jgi:uncharacterized membrane protein (UPF0127 family)
VRIAAGLRDRVVGLIGGAPLEPGHAFVIPGAGQVHTFGVRFAIDVAFCDDNGRMLHVVTSMKPGRVSRWVRGVAYAIEMVAGSLASTGPGDMLEFRGL